MLAGMIRQQRQCIARLKNLYLRASKSVARQILCSSDKSINKFSNYQSRKIFGRVKNVAL